MDSLKDLKITSLDVPIDDNEECTLSDLLPGVNDLEEKAIKSLSVVQFWEILDDILLPAESEVIKLLLFGRFNSKTSGRTYGRYGKTIPAVATTST